MNWELIRIGIDVLTVAMAFVMVIVLYFAHKSFKKVTAPMNMIGGMLGGLVNNKGMGSEDKGNEDLLYVPSVDEVEGEGEANGSPS